VVRSTCLAWGAFSPATGETGSTDPAIERKSLDGE
jgi:hypothetical protein